MKEYGTRLMAWSPLARGMNNLFGNEMLKEIADRHGVAIAQLPVAWAIAKGTLPIIGVTKVYQVEDAAKAAQILLSNEEMGQLETLAKEANVDTRGSWENPMA